MSDADLLKLAGNQHGYFTTAQAEAVGISRRALNWRTRQGVVEHVAHGLYRLGGYPPGARDELYALQAIIPTAVFSHETALEAYGLSDVLPSTIHLTVPPASGLKPRPGVTIHRSELVRTERVLRDDLWLTTVSRTLLDCARWGTDLGQLLAAFEAGHERGMFDPSALARLGQVYPFSGRTD
ncbi:MAG: type IV toxin-antitoxin system AbiEi family antitoxin domain-containing protein [Chloroflexota bacterium]|nr:type IV toxin-antitoxin system AbiEi family antitoxin domain-containing protein [Chloroflexota bacterium]